MEKYKKTGRPAHRLMSLAVVLGLAVAAVSCENVLVESPKAVAAEGFYQTAEEVESAVNAIYRPLRINTFPNYIATLECQSDWMYGRGSWTPLSDYQGLNDANITRVSGFWNDFYQAIRNANLVIQNAPKGEGIGAADVEKYVAEAKFLRAFTYFHLVRNWGGVPLRTEATMSEKDLAKSTAAQVYELIVADLQAAESALPETPKDVGRPSKWAAKTLLADVYMTLGNHTDAAARAKEVMDSGKFSLVQAKSVQDFQMDLFGPAILTTPEEIFYFKYSRLEAQGNYILWISNHPSTNLFKFGGAYAVHGDKTNPNFVEWDDEDVRKKLWDNISFGLGPNTLVSSKYVDKDAISQSGAGNDLPLYRYADVLLMYAEAVVKSEGSVSAQAIESLNRVRRRGYGFPSEVPSAIDITAADVASPEQFFDLVIKERGYEFLYEGKRWHELKRTGKVNELVLFGKKKTVADKHLLWPIPLSEMNYNGLLDPAKDQNPGY